MLVGGTSISRLKDYQRYATMGRVYQDPAAGTCPNLTMLENLSLADNKGRPYGAWAGASTKSASASTGISSPLWVWGWRTSWTCGWGPSPAASGRRVALLMATMTPLKFLILDEHTAALDPKTAETIMVLHRQAGPGVGPDGHDGHPQPPLRGGSTGTAILMMNRGRVVLDRAGAEKAATSMDDILAMFNRDLPGDGELTDRTQKAAGAL